MEHNDQVCRSGNANALVMYQPLILTWGVPCDRPRLPPSQSFPCHCRRHIRLYITPAVDTAPLNNRRTNTINRMLRSADWHLVTEVSVGCPETSTLNYLSTLR